MRIKERIRTLVRSVRERERRGDDWYERIPSSVLELFYMVILLLAVDLSVDGQINLGTISFGIPEKSMLVSIPEGVYLYALIGAGAYVTTSLIFDPKESVSEVKRLGYRMLAALPLGAGVFLLASFIIGPDASTVGQESNGSGTPQIGSDAILAGLAFIAGLYVRLTLRKLGDVAETIYNLGDVRTRSHKELQKRHEAMTNVRNAWKIPASRATSPEKLSSDGHDSLQKAEMILESENAPLEQLDRAVRLSEESVKRFNAAVQHDGERDP